MRIDEHIDGSQVKLLYLGKKNNETAFTEIVNIDSESNSANIIVCKPIIINEKYIMFPTLGLIAEITNPETGRVYRYRINLCSHIRYKGKTYFAMRSYDDVESFNRRSQFRVGFFAYGEIQPRANSMVYNCSVHNISFSGIGVHVRKDSKFNGTVGEYASIAFTHPRSERVYKVSGPIVRVDDSEINDEFYIVGVSVDTDATYWTRLVVSEERINIQKQRGLI